MLCHRLLPTKWLQYCFFILALVCHCCFVVKSWQLTVVVTDCLAHGAGSPSSALSSRTVPAPGKSWLSWNKRTKRCWWEASLKGVTVYLEQPCKTKSGINPGRRDSKLQQPLQASAVITNTEIQQTGARYTASQMSAVLAPSRLSAGQ